MVETNDFQKWRKNMELNENKIEAVHKFLGHCYHEGEYTCIHCGMEKPNTFGVKVSDDIHHMISFWPRLDLSVCIPLVMERMVDHASGIPLQGFHYNRNIIRSCLVQGDVNSGNRTIWVQFGKRFPCGRGTGKTFEDAFISAVGNWLLVGDGR